MTGIVILAAGASSRMGEPKQQLRYQQQTLLQHAIAAAAGVSDSWIVVVLGAGYELIRKDLPDEGIHVVHHPGWQQGMASTMQAGLRAMQAGCPQAESVLLMLCDQPFVNTQLLQQLISERVVQNAGIVACWYQDTLGTPVLFDQTYFPELLALQGEGGAKKLLYQHRDKVVAVPFEAGGIDIDTPQDYQQLIR